MVSPAAVTVMSLVEEAARDMVIRGSGRGPAFLRSPDDGAP
jgi:hypothetical protein